MISRDREPKIAGQAQPGIRLYTGTSLVVGYVASATTATATQGSIRVMDR